MERGVNVNVNYSGTPPSGAPSYVPDEYQPSPDISAAGGFSSPGLPKDTLIQAHEGEAVQIIPKQQTRDMHRAAQQGGAGGDKPIIIHNKLILDGRELGNWITQATRTGHVRVHGSQFRSAAGPYAVAGDTVNDF